MHDRGISQLSALVVTAVVLFGVAVYIQAAQGTIQTILDLRQLGPTLPHPPPCTWTLDELETIALRREIPIEVIGAEDHHRFGPDRSRGGIRHTRVSTVQLRQRCVQVLLTVGGHR